MPLLHEHHFSSEQEQLSKELNELKNDKLVKRERPKDLMVGGSFQELIDSACLVYFNMISPSPLEFPL